MAMADEGATWREVRDIGRGGFGYVTLCEKGNSNEYIAIKRCTQKSGSSEISSNMLGRWRLEIYIMGKLDHNNVVRAVELPPELSPSPGDPPVLAMEYCEGGDLRKVLNLPQNCCGLREPEIRMLVSGLGSAIEYLHSKRIIHRDLKPENIILKNVNSQTVYKIIDLGYVKELDCSSICNSFVGTLQYLAPEFNERRPYTKTVDYWSFGTLVFECLSGRRPFLPDATPVQWHENVRRKSPDHICAYFDDDENVNFSKTLPTSSNICRQLKNYFEEWLQLMLRFDPKARGGGVLQVQGENRPKCFVLMEQIMKLKILHIFHVEANTVLSYCVKPHHIINEVQKIIEDGTGIPVKKQVILQAKGQILHPSQKAYPECSDVLSDDVSVFLFSYEPMNPEVIRSRKPPAPAQAIHRAKRSYLLLKEQRRMWARAVLWCCEQNRDYKRLVLSQRAALLCLLRYNSEIGKQKAEMIKEKEKLFACAEHFRNGLDIDLQLHSQRLKNQNSEAIQERWQAMYEEVETMLSVHEEVQIQEKCVEEKGSEIEELQRSPFGRSRQPNSLESLEVKAKELYDSLIRSNKDENSINQEEMTDHVLLCSNKHDHLSSTLHKHINIMMRFLEQQKLRPVLPELTQVTERIIGYRKQLLVLQQQRQEEIWKLIDDSVTISSSKLRGLTLNTSQTALNTSQTQPTSALNESPFFQLGGAASLTMSMGTSNLESMQLVDDCKANSQRIQTVVESMLQDHEESLSFLSIVAGKR